ncbi:GNAT family N-acetyltransferase [Leifsonia poae]|uniref:GNAT family N-acetyltransferase n=1 Tax=Leifsonia poae TaxID=110933 RepID=UPI003D67A28D
MSENPEQGKYGVEYPDEAGYPDGTGVLSQDQTVLIDEVSGDPFAPGVGFFLVRNEEGHTFDAIVGDTQVATVAYEVEGNRMLLLSTTVWPEYRGQGIATELIRRVLDDVQERGQTVTVLCPIVRTFIDYNPSYEDLVDKDRPGILEVHRNPES